MYAVIRNYSGSGASELIDLIAGRKEEVESILGSIKGFVSWTMISTDAGGATVTICQDKAGTDESLQVAREWIQKNASDLSVDPPSVSEGPVSLHLG
ncbi:hypothetical protein N9H39_02305 [Gammaproteobacteria bacterium]|jgi:hypothetical protein|nr:hypothetical protein [Gammaproteobacteria bacterium]